ncbi:ribonuclease H-like domain-containing protein, partial [Tanacetum coccineum]
MLASPMDSSYPMIFVANSSNNSRSSSTPQGKSWKPCFNFAKGIYRFGESCRYVHDDNTFVPNNGFNKGRGTSENSTHYLLNKFLTQLGNLGMNMSNNGTTVPLPNIVAPNVPASPKPATHVPQPTAYYAGPNPMASTPVGPSALP